MSNGSERMSEHVKITNWAENVPLKNQEGVIIGWAKISDTGLIEGELYNSLAARTLYESMLFNVADGISIKPSFIPAKYSDEVRRRMQETKKEN